MRKVNGLIGKKPKDARAADRVTTPSKPYNFRAIESIWRWHRAASRRKP